MFFFVGYVGFLEIRFIFSVIFIECSFVRDVFWFDGYKVLISSLEVVYVLKIV